MRVRLLSSFLTLLLVACSGESPELVLWVTRFDYQTADDVRTALRAADDAGFDTVLWQVRGNATTFYPSQLEPWALELGGADPGFDPLAIALEEAQRAGLELHAWVNVMPAWWGSTPPPADYDHVYTNEPSWFWYDQFGERQSFSEKFYVSLNPCVPDVREHLVAVVAELLENYPHLDGLHLDYIRFPNEPPATGAGQDFPRDPRTLALFREATGLAPGDDPQIWDAWRSECVTTLLREIRVKTRSLRPKLELSAAVGPEPARALHHFQDIETWMAERLVDRLFPMNYTTDEARFAERLVAWQERAQLTTPPMPITMGVRLDAGPLKLRTIQVEDALAQFGSVACFTYSSLFDSPNEEIDAQDPETRTLRAERRGWFLPRLRRWTEPPH